MTYEVEVYSQEGFDVQYYQTTWVLPMAPVEDMTITSPSQEYLVREVRLCDTFNKWIIQIRVQAVQLD